MADTMKTFQEVADAMIPDERQRARYVAYMTRRWPNEEATQCATGYAQEWAERFNQRREFAASDGAGQRILAVMGD